MSEVSEASNASSPTAMPGSVDIGTTARRRSWISGGHFARLSGVYVLGVLILVYGLWIPNTFLTTATFEGIVRDQAVTGIVVIGLVVALATGVFDLSFANNLGLSGVICGDLLYHHYTSTPLSIVITLAAGIAIGLVNAFFVVVLGVSAIVATLGMSSVLLAVTEWLTAGGNYMTGFPKSFTGLTSGTVWGISILGVYFLLVAILGWYVLEHTPLGRRMQAVGASTEAARLAGIATKRMTVISLVVVAGLSSLGGVLITSSLDGTTPTIGSSYLLPAFAAAFLGATQIKPGRFNVGGSVLAIALLAVGVKGLQLAGGGQAWINDAFNGAALLVAVSLAAASERGLGARSRRRSPLPADHSAGAS